MKKALVILLISIFLLSLFSMSSMAAPDPMAEKFTDALDLLDHFYEYDYNYMIRIASDRFIDWSADICAPTTVPCEEFDAVLHEYFVITDSQIEELRDYANYHYQNSYYDKELQKDIYYDFYDHDANTYTFQYMGAFGGSLPPRQYLGYVKNGNTYDVYYQNISYAFLEDYLPEGMDEWEYAESLDWPEYIEMDGIRFTEGPEGYCALLSYDDYGRKYTVELNGEIVRIISCTNYTKADLPDAFDDKEIEDEVIYDLPENSGVSIPENNCFASGTTVKAEQIVDGSIMTTVRSAMVKVAEKFAAFEFTATKEGVSVQPNGEIAVTFAIPDNFSTNVKVYYMSVEGALEELQITIDDAARTVTAKLFHFSTYILSDEDSKPHQHSYDAAVTEPTCTEKGYTTYTCTCGDSYTADETDMIDHTMGEWTETKAPSYTEEGEETRSCANCDHVETRPVEVLEKPEDDKTPEDDNTSEAPDVNKDNTANEEDGDAADDKNGEKSFSTAAIAIIIVAVIALGAAAVIFFKKKG